MNLFDQIRNNIQANNDILLNFLQQVELIARETGNEKLSVLINESKDSISQNLALLEQNSKELYGGLQSELQKRTNRLKKKVEELQRSRETIASDNFFLEFKKKDLLQLATHLEDAYEEITKQTVQLKEANAKILEKNKELEAGKEALLDQTDYLHEATQTISRMHSEVEKQREEILRKNEELLSLNLEKNNLIGIVAHDLKSPLNQVKGLITLLKITLGNPDKETLQVIDMMENSITRLSNMIGKILDVEAIESKQLNLNIEKTDLTQLLKSVCERFRIEADEKMITLHEQLETGVFARVDKDYTEQIFQNLLSNAIKFSPKDKNVFISLTSNNERIICEVRDEGPGITEEDKKKLFGKYQKLSARPTGNETSTGLGLSIVKKFVESMNGEIWCESEECKGASFFVAFDAS